ncbi:uncharacterized protein [Amphiura filiformis]|uniref:uncharacterized protein n=1 Tax=Amphiura filiformis TaxID=82378 RepID=UPI003B20BAEA
MVLQRTRREWDYLDPQVCKYCRRVFYNRQRRYLRHLRHHELSIIPYWYDYKRARESKVRKEKFNKYVYKPVTNKSSVISVIVTSRPKKINKASSSVTRRDKVDAGHVSLSFTNESSDNHNVQEGILSPSGSPSVTYQAEHMPPSLASKSSHHYKAPKRVSLPLVTARDKFLEGHVSLASTNDSSRHEKHVKGLVSPSLSRESSNNDKVTAMSPILTVDSSHRHKVQTGHLSTSWTCEYQYDHEGFTSSVRVETHFKEKSDKSIYLKECFANPTNFDTPEQMHTARRPYKCQYCSKDLSNLSDLIAHKRIHTQKKLYRCQYCHKSFIRSRNLQKHEEIHTKQTICNIGFSPAKDAVGLPKRIDTTEEPCKCERSCTCLRHMSNLIVDKKARTDEMYSCPYCNKGFTTSSKLKVHERQMHTTEKPFKCQHCNKAYTQSHYLKKHESIHTESYKCQYCSKILSSAGHLRRHERIHNKVNIDLKPNKCQYCNKGFARANELKRHERTHTTDKKARTDEKMYRYPCPYCYYGCNYPSLLKVHVRRKHTKEKPYKCQYCYQGFADSSSKTLHEWIHFSDKPNKCRYCNKSFARSNDMKRHERTHTKEKPYSCKYCNKTYAQSHNLQKHEWTHTESYNCQYCSKTLSSAGHLRRHELIHNKVDTSSMEKHEQTHTKEKKIHKCQYCCKGFTRSSNLQKHERIHTKPMKCQICNRGFANSDNLNRHVRIHTNETPYKCQFCNKRLQTNDQLKKPRTNTHFGKTLQMSILR